MTAQEPILGICPVALPTKLAKCGELSGCFAGGQYLPEFPFGKHSKILPVPQPCRVGDYFFWQGQQLHDLRHTGAGNAVIGGYSGHIEGGVGIEHGTPFQGDLNWILGGLNGSAICPTTAVQVGQTAGRVGDWMNDERTCAPSGKGDAHNGGW